MNDTKDYAWIGLKSSARELLETRDYTVADLAGRLGSSGVQASEAMAGREELGEVWIPGVEMFPRRVFQQKGRGYFAELTRISEGVLNHIGLVPKQWASALMHRESAKGFHIHPPFIPEGVEPSEVFKTAFLEDPENYSRRHYDKEQWDVMFFLTGICEMILIDERAGMPRRVMRFIIPGDSRPGPDNAAVVIPPGVAHALRNIGNEDLLMVYGTSTSFNPHWEGRIQSGIEAAPLPEDWSDYIEKGV